MALALLLALIPAIHDAQAGEPGISVEDAVMRVTLPSLLAAGYMCLKNASDKPVVLTGAMSPACDRIMIHQSVGEGGVDTMRMVERLPVPAHGDVRFAPAGYHLMCLSPSPTLASQAKVPVTLSFDNGASVTADFAVHRIGKE